MKKIIFNFRIEVDVLNKLKKLGKEKDRSIGYLIRKAVHEYLKENRKV